MNKPPTIRDEVIADEHALVRGVDQLGECLLAFDALTRCGGVYSMRTQMWTLFGPCAFDEFLSALTAVGVQTVDLEAWRTTVARDASSIAAATGRFH